MELILAYVPAGLEIISKYFYARAGGDLASLANVLIKFMSDRDVNYL